MRRVIRGCGCLALAAGLWAAGGSLMQRAPQNVGRRVNPSAGVEDDWKAGHKLYLRECAECHGESGEGGRKAPPLKQPEVMDAAPGAVFWAMTNGSLWRGMPSFAHLPEAQRWQIVTYLQKPDQK